MKVIIFIVNNDVFHVEKLNVNNVKPIFTDSDAKALKHITKGMVNAEEYEPEGKAMYFGLTQLQTRILKKPNLRN